MATLVIGACTYPRPADVPDLPTPCPSGDAAECPNTAADPSCGQATCIENLCGMTFVPNGQALDASQQVAGDCTTAVCDGNGARRTDPAPSDPEDDHEACTDDSCVDGATRHDPHIGMVSCYDGAEGTAGVGPCTSGMVECSGGHRNGPCVGQVVPATESCDVALVDEDCDGEINESGAACNCSPGTTLDCYTGTTGTEGIGACHQGTKTCDPDGRAYGACVGQVVDRPSEVCDGGVAMLDENCNMAVDEGCVCAPSQPTECPYSGPVGTKGVGVCRASTKMCSADGKSFTSACAGEVLPTYDWCQTATTDEDCSGTSAACTGTWNSEVANSGRAGVFAVAPDGSSLHAGFFPVGPTGGTRLQKISATGVVTTVKDIAATTGTYGIYPSGVAIDSTGAMLVAGQTNGSVDFGGGLHTVSSNGTTSNRDAYVAKYNANGTYVWSKVFDLGHYDTNTNGSIIYGLAVDAANNVYIVGQTTYEPMDFGGGALGNPSNTTANPITCQDAFVAKYTSAGVHVYSRRYTSSSGCYNDYLNKVAADPSGNAYVTTVPGVDVGSSGGYIHKLDANGNWQWADATFYAKALVATATGVIGNVGSTVFKLSTTGSLAWQHAVPGGGTQTGVWIGVSSTGQIATLTQFTNSSPNLGTGAVPAGNYFGIGVYDSTGAALFAEYARGFQYGDGVGIDNNNDVTVALTIDSTATNPNVAGVNPGTTTSLRTFAIRLDR